MIPLGAPVTKPAISMPSRRLCGSDSISLRFMYAPGSPSSALQMRYFSGPAAFCRNSHLLPVR